MPGPGPETQYELDSGASDGVGVFEGVLPLAKKHQEAPSDMTTAYAAIESLASAASTAEPGLDSAEPEPRRVSPFQYVATFGGALAGGLPRPRPRTPPRPRPGAPGGATPTPAPAVTPPLSEDARDRARTFDVAAPGAGSLGLHFRGSNVCWSVEEDSPLAGRVYPACALVAVNGESARGGARAVIAAIKAAAGDAPRTLTFRRPVAAMAASEAAERVALGDVRDRRRGIFSRRPRAGARADVVVGDIRGRRVVVKTLKADATARDAMDLLSEAALLSRLAPHVNVARLAAAPAADSAPFVALAYCEGRDMQALMEAARVRRSALPAAAACDAVAQLCRALDHLHSGAALGGSAVIHRDVKPANIVLTPVKAGGSRRFTATLVDFGLARRVDDGRALTAATGSRRWMAPEVFLGSDYGPPADVYGAAHVLWAALTLRCPYAEADPEAHFRGVCQADERPPLDAVGSPLAEELLRRAWAPAADDRPAAAQVARDCDCVLAGLGRQSPFLSFGGSSKTARSKSPSARRPFQSPLASFRSLSFGVASKVAAKTVRPRSSSDSNVNVRPRPTTPKGFSPA